MGGRLEQATIALSKLRGQPRDSECSSRIVRDRGQRGVRTCYHSGSWLVLELGQLLQGKFVAVQIELTTYYFGHFLADDATMDWCQLHLLLLHPFPTVYRSHRQHVPHFAHLHPGQRLLHTIVILDC